MTEYFSVVPVKVYVYSASKSAVNTIARVAANELAERKIHMNMVTPGATRLIGQ